MSSQNCSTIKQTAHSILQKYDNLNVLWLKGTPIERARAHGELLGNEFTLNNLRLFIALSMRGIEKNTFKFKVIDQALNYLVRWAGADAPRAYLDETKIMAEASNQSPLKLRRALLLPDIAAFSWALLSKQGKNLPAQGCTSALFTDESGYFLQGRNLDFPGSPSYDQNPLLVIHHPEEGSTELKHVSVGTQGLQFSGITGFNEAGITFAVHQNYTRLLSIKGVPMPFVGELVLRSARNLEEALKIIKENRPGPLWSFVLSDLKTNDAMTVEISNTHLHVRKKEGPYFSQANHLSPKMKSEVTLMDAGTVHNSGFRFQKALNEMTSWKKPGASEMAHLLSWQADRKNFSPVSDVMKSLTIQSVIYEKAPISGENNFYVTIDSAPAPAGRWAKFQMNSFWDKNTFVSNDIEVFDFIKLPLAIRDNQKKWVQVYEHEILRHYRQVVEHLAPLAESPDSYLALGAIQLKVARPTDALVSVQRGLNAAKESTPRLITQGLKWVEIISLWQLSKKSVVLNKALSLWNEGIIDPGVAREVKRLLQKKSPSKSSLSPDFDFFGGYLQGLPSRPSD